MKGIYKRKGIILFEVMLTIAIMLVVYGIGAMSFRSYYSAQLAERKMQCDMIDRALEGYAKNHLAVKTMEKDKDGNETAIYQKTYPATLNELEKLGYLNHFRDMDEDDFKYTPHREKTYGNTQNYTYYELKVKVPNGEGYYTSPGSARSKYISEND